jgi:hypothetical protein
LFSEKTFIGFVFFIITPKRIHKFPDAINQVRHVQFEWIVQDIVADEVNFSVIPAERRKRIINYWKFAAAGISCNSFPASSVLSAKYP